MERSTVNSIILILTEILEQDLLQPVPMEEDDKENLEKSKLRKLSNVHVCVSELYTTGEFEASL